MSDSKKPWEETWRVGRKVGRTIYTHDEAGGDGELIGVLDTREQAALAAAAPELYRALARLYDDIYFGDQPSAALKLMVEHALEKARGER